MATRRYPEGVPCWIDAVAPDPERARDFYGRALGWSTELITQQAARRTYFLGSIDGLAAGGIGSGDGERARWTTYMAVDDVEAVVRRVTEAGGEVRDGPYDAGDHGRVARCADPDGAIFGLWQAGRTAGVEVVRVPGAWNVSDLHCVDEDGAARFYGAVFGWTLDTVDIGAGEWASMFRARGDAQHSDDDPDDRDSAGHTPRGADDAIGWIAPLEPEDPGAHWRVTFTVGNRDDAIAVAQRLGAEIISTRDTRWTRSAVVRDPQGALFTFSQALSGR